MNEVYVDGVRLHLGSILKAIGEAMLEPLSQPSLGSLQVNQGYVTDLDLEPRGDYWSLRFKIVSGMTFKDVTMDCPRGDSITLKNLYVSGLTVEARLLPAIQDGKAVMFEYQDAKEGK